MPGPWTKFVSCTVVATTFFVACAHGQMVRQPLSPAEIIMALTAKEAEASKARPAYLYTSYERSERTGGKLWRELVADLPDGRIRMLVEEDGHCLSPARRSAERERVERYANDPSLLVKDGQSQKEDYRRAQRMMELLPKAFLFQQEGLEGRYLRITFRPNPAYAPKSFEERVMHTMAGSLLVEPREFRLHQLEARMMDDVSFGLGLLATLHGGSNFHTVREEIAPSVWKTAKMETHFDGKAIFFKTINREQVSEHVEFRQLPSEISTQQAILLLLKESTPPARP